MATNPTLLTMPIAENGQKNTIPATQAAAGDGLLSQSTGFPPETALPLGAGGKAPTREDFNGAFNLLSDIAFYAQKGWTFQYDATQDYFKGCLVIDPSDGLRYECLNDMVAGTVSPHEDTNNDYWKVFSTGGGVAVGFIMPYAGTGLQEGWLDCDGSAVSRTMYPDLFAAIGTTWGAGDGSTTFNLPNLIEAAILNGFYTKTTFTTAGSTTFTAPKSGFYKITVKGGGGGGSGSSNLYNNTQGGSGGGEGGATIGYEKMTAGDTATVVVGAGGTGGAAGSGSGSNGGNSTVTINNNTYTGGGGGGGISINFPGGGGVGTVNGAPGSAVSPYPNTNGGFGGGSGGGTGGGTASTYGTPATATQGGGGAGAPINGSSSYKGGDGGDGYVWFEYIGVTPKFLIKAFDGPTPSSAGIDLTQYAQDLAKRLTREQTPAFNHRDVITTSGTYTAPVTGWYKITAKGGGGGGGGGYQSSNTYIGGGGGGEGGTTIGYEKMTAGDTVTVVVGAGGIGGNSGSTNGTNGGDSIVTANSNTYTGGGGEGGYPGGGSGAQCRGGIGGTGTYNGNSGGSGETMYSLSASGGVGGGNGGGTSSRAVAATSGTQGGGGGGGAANSAAGFAGGNGGDGFAWVEYFDPSLN